MKHISQDKYWCDEVENPGRIIDVFQLLLYNCTNLQSEQVKASSGLENSDYTVLRFETVIVLKIWKNDIRPVPEEDQINHHWQTNKEIVDLVPVTRVTVNNDLYALQIEDF